MKSPLILVAVLLAAPAAAQDQAESMPTDASPPFTAAQIRDATNEGRTYVFSMTDGEGNVMHRRMRFTDVGDAGARMEGAMVDADGNVLGEPRASQPSWDELVGHATYPAANTVISDGEITVGAGTYDCMVYTVTDGSEITRAHFARDLPGAPVSMVVEVDGVVVSRMELVSYEAGE